MKNKQRKQLQLHYAKENIEHFFSLLDKRFYPKYDHLYIKEIKRLTQGFNIRLTREQKLKFCKKCHVYWDSNTREIRLNPTLKAKEHICKNCGSIRRFVYK